MHPRIEILTEKKLVGKQLIMSFADNKTTTLWQSFMPLRKSVSNSVGLDLYSVEIYPPRFFDIFDPHAAFEKWAAIEVSGFENIPSEMKELTLTSGLYAVFLHKGPASEGPRTYDYIFTTWLASAPFVLDNRPHLAVMGENYKNNDPSSEEDLWIPIKSKGNKTMDSSLAT
jgi:AraC family transcriptional regulator